MRNSVIDHRDFYHNNIYNQIHMFTTRLMGVITNPKALLLILTCQMPWMQNLFHSLVAHLGQFSYFKWLAYIMILDLLTGVVKVWKTQGLEYVTSKGIRDTVDKCIQYGSFIALTYIITHFRYQGQQVNKDWIFMNKLAFELLMLIEGKSVYENLVKINPKLDFVKTLFEKISGFFVNKDK